jgi:hypothetical protein
VTRYLLKLIVLVLEKNMADYSKLMADLDVLSAKVDVLLAPAPEPIPVPDEQPAVDAADAAVQAILAKFPA